KCKPCLNAYHAEWARRNPEKSRAAHERWAAKKPPDAMREQRRAARERARASGARRFYYVKSKYGVARPDYEQMMISQGNVCAICGASAVPGKHLYVDHEHSTGLVRGLLCQHCNSGLGMFQDDVERMRSAIAYLDRQPTQPSMPFAPAI